MDSPKITIRKYENRRLYDTSNSRYINLDEIAAMIRQGADVQVLDARTGEDLTRLVLTQIIVEDAKEREFALPLDVLRQLVIASGRASQEALANYAKAVMSWYETAYRAFGTPTNPLEMMRNMMTPPAPPSWPSPEPPPAKPPEPAPPSAADVEIGILLRRVEDLERKLSAGKRTPKERKPRDNRRRRA